MKIPPGLRLAFGLLSVFPVRFEDADRRTFASAMAWSPVVGLVIGVCQALTGAGLRWAGASWLLAAAVSLAAGAVLTRALHLDGLADVADGLGSGKPPEEAQAVMKRSDIGPFGVITLLFTLLIQAAALSSARHQALVVIVAAVAGRVAIAWACTPGNRAARADGLGASVAQSVPLRVAALLTAALLVLTALVTLLWTRDAETVLLVTLAPAVALLSADLFRRHLIRRFDGVTGDVLGALCELAVTLTLVVAVLG
ncbi:adenosylcobinamide-GDP ribazoletransferase [Actinocorallia longicatena]|uniref:Adenosylcobinamide-GDP ribazoletransferase n=1 Tax=Actinocorallia longicatena TaxID=111803 RepID=A0ABP6QAK6_9ACTN